MNLFPCDRCGWMQPDCTCGNHAHATRIRSDAAEALARSQRWRTRGPAPQRAVQPPEPPTADQLVEKWAPVVELVLAAKNAERRTA